MNRFTRKIAQSNMTPRATLTLWWALNTLRYPWWKTITGRVSVGGRSATLEWKEPAELLQAMTIFGPENPWNRWQPDTGISTVVDVGANIGQTIAYWALRFPQARLGAVEMMPENAVRVEDQCRRNQWAIKVLQVAAAGKEGKVSVRRSLANSRHRLDEIVNRSAVRDRLSEEHMEVPALTLGMILDRLGFATVDLMKMDIEGAEALLLPDAANWAPRVKNLIIEVHDNVDQALARKQLETAGYRISLLDSGIRDEWFCTQA